MGYQALLFCPDEKLARVVTQVFSELDFTVDPVHEPFAAVKKLMAQHYDALVVDCGDDQNATLLFKSARNSVSNQSSLALALVEGQAGVAKAYRIGANLVLTKPINVEQAKGTLRVARGLLRKNSDAASASVNAAVSPSAPVPADPAPAPSPAKPDSHSAEPVAPTKSKYDFPEFESPLPVMAAAKVANTPMDASISVAQTKVSVETDSPAQTQHQSSTAGFVKPAAAPAPTAAPKSPVASLGNVQGAAAAPAPAKEKAAHTEKRTFESLDHVEAGSSAYSSASAVSAPSFAALEESDSGGSGGKKFLVVAAVLLIVAGLGYVGWTKLGNRDAVPQPVTALHNPVSVPSPAPTAAPPALPAGSKSQPAAPTAVSPAAAASEPQFAKPAPATNSSPTIKIAVDPEPVAKKTERPPIVVKSGRKTQAQAEEAALLVPNPLGVASSNEKNLSTLVPSEPASLPKASLATLKISQGVSQGLLIKRVQPKYPPNALAMRIQGSVQLEATINKEGSIANLKLLNGDPLLGRAAMEAVRQWRYKPYYLDSEPVEIQTQITVIFRLPN
jgi:periplasmic protein TonB